METKDLPKCDCGIQVGLSFHGERHWCRGCLWSEVERLQAEKGIVEVQRDAARLRDNAKLVSSLEAEVEQLREERDGMTQARDRFCGGVNKIARALGMTGKDHFAPEAILRKAEELRAIVGKFPTTADGVPVIVGETKVYIRDMYTDDILEGIVYCLNVGIRLEEKTYVLLRFEDEEERCVGDRHVLLNECYSTREAAQAAGGE